MSDETTYSLSVHFGSLSKKHHVETVRATKHTTAAEVVSLVASRLGINDGKSFVLVELHDKKGEEMVLAQSDCPVQRMLLWPLQYQMIYKFLLRQTDKDGTILYSGASTWQAKVDKDSTQHDMAQKGFLPPTEPAEKDYPDLCALSNSTQEKILDILKMRFMKDKIYTYTANMLISINPYKFLPIYNPKFMTIYQNRKKEELAPHIYAIADTAFTKMVESKHNQCIVITGKSGSGKTQATHYLVHHTLALCQKSYMTGVEHMLIGCGPVLEAFGNAQTEHNNNSSRFGKFLRIYFYDTGLLSGADIQTYLLEKSRLIHQEPNERNFHVFYYLLCGASDEELKELHLSRDMTFEYVKKENMQNEHEASSELNRLRQAMEVIGFFKGAQKNIFKLIAAILHLGNITFRIKKGRDESLEIEDEQHLDCFCQLLALDPSLVRKCLLTRKAKAGAGERFVLDLKLNEAIATRDAMAKALYQNLFEWTVNSINMALAQKTRDNTLRSQSRWIGLLDIFGFEDFVKNSFEQFCINYASEHLQHYCIKHTFQIEQEAYREEGLTWNEIAFADNSGCIDLYEKKPMGLFYLLDENFPGANNQTLLSQFNRVHKNNPYYESPVVKEDAFIIKHYAGKVKYQIKDFREKNHDQVREDIITVVRATKSSFIQEVISKSPASLFRWSILRAVVRAMFAFRCASNLPKDQDGSSQDAWRLEEIDGKQVQAAYVHKKLMTRLSHQRSKSFPVDYTSRYEASHGSFYGKKRTPVSRNKKKIISISQQYQASLVSLLSALEKAAPYYVRCIQPNNSKVPLKIDDKLVLHQLRCSGTLQTILLEQSRYPERFTGDQFLERYKLLFPKNKRTMSLDEIESYLISRGLEPKVHFQNGHTKVFLRYTAFQALRDELHQVVQKHVIFIQSQIRGWLARRCYLQQRAAAIKIQSFWRMVECQKVIEEWHLSATIIQEAWSEYQTRKLQRWLVPLQAHCRGYLARHNIKKKRLSYNEKAAAIQRTWLRYKKRATERSAATKIQAFYRGHLARGAFIQLKDEKARSSAIARIEPDLTPLNQSLPKTRESTSYPSLENDEVECRSSSASNDSYDQSRDHPYLAMSKKPTLSDLTSQLNFIDDDDDEDDNDNDVTTTPDREVTKPVVHRADASERDRFDDVTKRHSNGIRERITVPPDNLPLPHATSARKLDSPLGGGRYPVDDALAKSRSLPGYQSEARHGPYDGCKAGGIFVKSAIRNKADRDVILSHAGLLDSKEDQGASDSDAGDIVPSPTSSSRDSLDERPSSRPIYPLGGKTLSGRDLASSKGAFTSMSFPQLPQVGRRDNAAAPYNKTLSSDSFSARKNKQTHLPSRSVSTESTYTETTFSADSRSVIAQKRNKSRDLELLEKEWLAFQRVEHERQLRERDRKISHGKQRQTPQERKISDELMSLRLQQMSALKQKMELFGLTPDAMPELSLSRRTSEKSTPSTPTSPTASAPVHSIPEHAEVTEPVKTSSLPRSASMESIHRNLSKKKPKRQRSNSAVEMFIDMRAPSSDPITRKASSLNAVNAAAFAKKCMEENKLEKVVDERDSTEKLNVSTNQSENKRGSALFEVVKKKLWSGAKNNKHPPPLTSKKSSESLISLAASSDKPPPPEESPPVEVKVRSTVAEEFSPMLCVSKPDELVLLEKFMKSKILNFADSNKVDQVFKSALNEFCSNLTAIYSYAMLAGSTSGLRYKDIVSNFRQVLEKKAKEMSLDQYAAMMAVNGFRGYMNQFMKDVLPKHISKETKIKKKKSKDDVTEKMGHRFFQVQWGINQVCEVCGGTMWMMETGLTCQTCKFACHKKCINKLASRCPGAPTDKSKTKPRKLFGEPLVGLEANDSLVPAFIDKCISYMEANGIYQEGIYRRSAATTQVKQLVEALDRDIECQKVNFDDYNIHAVASCFKKFFRSLPDPLVPCDKYFEFFQASNLSCEHEKITSLFSVVEGIPEHNHATLERVVFHLARVAQQEPTNLMSPSNLAIVFTPCFISPPSHVSPVTAAQHIGIMTKGIELIIAEQVKKIRKTLENLSEIHSVENSTSEKLEQLRKSMGKGKGKKKRLRPSFREGLGSSSFRRPHMERQLSLGAVEENAALVEEEQHYEMEMLTLRNQKESLTTRLPALSRQLSNEGSHFQQDGHTSNPYMVTNEHLRHLNKHRAPTPTNRRRPSKFSSSLYAPSISTATPHSPDGSAKLVHKTSSPSKSRFMRMSSSSQHVDSFKRTSQLRNPIHRPRKKKRQTSSPFFGKDIRLGKTKGTAV